MAKLIIDGSTLTGIADAVRSKEGSTGAIPFTDIASRILALKNGGGTIYTGTITVSAGTDAIDVNVGVTLTGDELFIMVRSADSTSIRNLKGYHPHAMIRIPAHMTSNNAAYIAMFGTRYNNGRFLICHNSNDQTGIAIDPGVGTTNINIVNYYDIVSGGLMRWFMLQ